MFGFDQFIKLRHMFVLSVIFLSDQSVWVTLGQLKMIEIKCISLLIRHGPDGAVLR